MVFLTKISKSFFISGLVFLTSALKPVSEDCHPYFLLEEPAELIYYNFSASGKKLSSVVSIIHSKTISGAEVKFHARSTSKSLDEKDQGEINYDVCCDNGIFKMDMAALVNPQLMRPYQNMEVRIDQKEIALSIGAKEEDELANGKVKIKIIKKGIRVATVVFIIKKNHIEGFEKITTPAGTFDCIKLSYEAMTSSGFNSTKSKETVWMAQNIGQVKKRVFNNKGELMEYSELTKINR